MGGAIGGPPFLGRHSEFEMLASVLARVGDGLPATVFIEGEPGIGKTRLLEEALNEAPAGTRVLRAAAREIERSRPFGAVAEALGVNRSSPDPERARLAHLLLREAAGEGPIDPKTGAHVRYQFVEAVVEHVERLAIDAPLVLAIDDLHWADASTVLTVDNLVRRLRDVAFGLVATFRPAHMSRDLDRMLEAVADDGVVHLVLGPLCDAAVSDLASAVVGAPPGPLLRHHLKRTHGNPLFVVELLRALADEGGLTSSEETVELARYSLPPTVRLVLLRRFSHLAPQTLEILKLASVLGASFDVTRLAQVARRSTLELAPLLEEALHAGVLRDGGTHFVFRHDLIRESMYEDLPAPVRAAVHLEIAWILADSGATPIEVVHHIAAGARPGDSRAIHWLHDAARNVLALAPGTAVELLERALALTDQTDPARDRLSADLVVALMWCGGIRQAEELAREILNRPHDSSVTPVVRLVLMDALMMQGRVNDMTRESKVALSDQPLSASTRGHLLALAAGGAVYQGRPELAAILAGEAHAHALAAGDDSAISLALGIQGFLALVQARGNEAITRLTDALQMSKHSASKATLRSTYSPYILLGLALAEADRVTEAIETFREGLRHGAELGFAGNQPLFHWGLAQFYFLIGQWDDAITEAETGFVLAGDIGAGMGSTMAHVALALIAFHRNEMERAHHELALAEAAFARFGPHFVFDWLEAAQASLAESSDEHDRALHVLERGWSRREEIGVAIDLPVLGPDLTALCLRAGNLERATVIVRRLDELATQLPVPSVQCASLRARGLLENDADLLIRAVEVARGGPRVLETALACESASAALSSTARRSDAVKLLQEAAEIYEELAAVRGLSRVSARLRSLGVQKGQRGPRRRPSSGWESLTSTEAAVVELVTDGLTTREIAQRLFVSPRTVECHLSHIFRKLGLASRTALRTEARRRAGAEQAYAGRDTAMSATRPT